MKIKEKFLTTGIGSLPYIDAEKAVELSCNRFDIPFWPQLPKRGFKENMYVQFAQGLPSLFIDDKKKKIYVDTTKDLSEGLGKLYEIYISNDYMSLGLTRDFAEGFCVFLDRVKDLNHVKGQITGPVSLGLSIVDEKGKSIIYNDTLRDALIKLLEIKAAYQVDKLKVISKKIIIFIDEPYLTGFGSSFVSIERPDVKSMLNSVIEKIHSKGALSGIHCCGNTDWSLLAETDIDIINFDAYAYLDSLLLYPESIKVFLKRGGYLAWGIVPTSEDIAKETPESLFKKLVSGIDILTKKLVPKDLIISNSILAPSCGMGTLSEKLAEDIIAKLSSTRDLAKEQF